MKNGYSVTWSDEALRNLDDIFNYLETNFSEREIRRFARKLDKMVAAIVSQPDAFPVLEVKREVRRCVLSKQTTIYYQVLPERHEISIVTLYDNRKGVLSIRV